MNEQWICSCGKVNTGSFCAACGRSKQQCVDSSVQPNSYNQGFNPIDAPVQTANDEQFCLHIKKWKRSPVIVVGAIVALLLFAAMLADYAFTVKLLLASGINLKKFSTWLGTPQLLTGALNVFLMMFVCIGFWKTRSSGKKEGKLLYGGEKMARGVYVFYEVLLIIVLSVVLLLIVLIVFLGTSILSKLGDVANSLINSFFADSGIAPYADKFLGGTKKLLYIVLAVAVALYVIALIALVSVSKGTGRAIKTIKNGSPEKRGAGGAGFFMIIFALIYAGSFAMKLKSPSVLVPRIKIFVYAIPLLKSLLFVLGAAACFSFNKARKRIRG